MKWTEKCTHLLYIAAVITVMSCFEIRCNATINCIAFLSDPSMTLLTRPVICCCLCTNDSDQVALGTRNIYLLIFHTGKRIEKRCDALFFEFELWFSNWVIVWVMVITEYQRNGYFYSWKLMFCNKMSIICYFLFFIEKKTENSIKCPIRHWKM